MSAGLAETDMGQPSPYDRCRPRRYRQPHFRRGRHHHHRRLQLLGSGSSEAPGNVSITITNNSPAFSASTPSRSRKLSAARSLSTAPRSRATRASAELTRTRCRSRSPSRPEHTSPLGDDHEHLLRQRPGEPRAPPGPALTNGFPAPLRAEHGGPVNETVARPEPASPHGDHHQVDPTRLQITLSQLRGDRGEPLDT